MENYQSFVGGGANSVNDMSYELHIIDYRSVLYPEVLVLRRNILRTPLGLSLTEEDTADDRNQFITLAKTDQAVIGCLLIKPVSSTTVKFRQMAIDEDYQFRGIGSTLLHYAENFCLMNNYKFCELHARKEAIPFYKKNEYLEIGIEFMEVGILHKKMIKNLEPVLL
jgi:predicted GNAT family N-acyltransferase